MPGRSAGRQRGATSGKDKRGRGRDQEHRDLDAAIEALRGVPGHDQIQLARLKKRKLRLRDEIAILQDMLIPDIIA